jgi:hypothetical protein
MPASLGRPIRNFLALSVTAATLTAVSLPVHAGDGGGAVAAGILGGTALGVLAGAAIAAAPAPAPGLLRASLCPAATAAALLVRTARGVDRLRLCNPASARL